MRRSRSSPVSLPFLPNLSEIEFLGLSLEGPFEDLDDELLLLLKELVDGLEGELLELEDLLESFLPGFPLFPELQDSRRVSSSCIQ